MEKHTQFTCERKNHKHVACNMEIHTRFTGDMNNLSTISNNLESHTQFTSDKENLTNFAYNLEIIYNFPWNVIFSRNFAPHPAEFVLRLKKFYCKPKSASCIKQPLGNWLLIYDVFILPKRECSDRLFPLLTLIGQKTETRYIPGWKHMAAMLWFCHDLAMMTAWRSCFLAWSSWFMPWSRYDYPLFHVFLKKNWSFCRFFFQKFVAIYYIWLTMAVDTGCSPRNVWKLFFFQVEKKDSLYVKGNMFISNFQISKLGLSFFLRNLR